jgi:hypothetical protein
MQIATAGKLAKKLERNGAEKSIRKCVQIKFEMVKLNAIYCICFDRYQEREDTFSFLTTAGTIVGQQRSVIFKRSSKTKVAMQFFVMPLALQWVLAFLQSNN